MYSEIIKKAMKTKGFTQESLSRLTKIPLSSLAHMLSHNKFKISSLEKISKALDLQLILKSKADKLYTKDDIINFGEDIINEIILKQKTIDK